MPLCKNTDEKRYTGKENTPLGKGYSASVEKLGKRMKGADGNMYEVIRIKGGKRWKCVTKKVTSPRMFGFLGGNNFPKMEAEIIELDQKYHGLKIKYGDNPSEKQANELSKLREKIHQKVKQYIDKYFEKGERDDRADKFVEVLNYNYTKPRFYGATGELNYTDEPPDRKFLKDREPHIIRGDYYIRQNLREAGFSENLINHYAPELNNNQAELAIFFKNLKESKESKESNDYNLPDVEILKMGLDMDEEMVEFLANHQNIPNPYKE